MDPGEGEAGHEPCRAVKCVYVRSLDQITRLLGASMHVHECRWSHALVLVIMPSYAFNISGCILKYQDYSTAVTWLERAVNEVEATKLAEIIETVQEGGCGDEGAPGGTLADDVATCDDLSCPRLGDR